MAQRSKKDCSRCKTGLLALLLLALPAIETGTIPFMAGQLVVSPWHGEPCRWHVLSGLRSKHTTLKIGCGNGDNRRSMVSRLKAKVQPGSFLRQTQKARDSSRRRVRVPDDVVTCLLASSASRASGGLKSALLFGLGWGERSMRRVDSPEKMGLVG